MAVSAKPRSPFGDLLRDVLEEKNITIRGLARTLAATRADDTDLESVRRMLQRYIAGDVNPGERVRNQIADALDEPRARFTEDREQQEQLRRLAVALKPLADELLRIATEARHGSAG